LLTYLLAYSTQQSLPTDDDSDVDLVTDYLDAPTLVNSSKLCTPTTSITTTTTATSTSTTTPSVKNYFVSTVDIKNKDLMSHSSDLYSNGTAGSGSNHFNVGSNNNTITITTPSGQNHTTAANNNNITINNNNHNMVPIISVTPHSPGAKYNSILEDSLNHLQSIRETVVQMKNSSAQNTNFGNIGIINPTVRSFSVRFPTCFADCILFPNSVGIV